MASSNPLQQNIVILETKTLSLTISVICEELADENKEKFL